VAERELDRRQKRWVARRMAAATRPRPPKGGTVAKDGPFATSNRRERRRAVVATLVASRASSQCRCGEAFDADTARQAIARRRDHEYSTGHGLEDLHAAVRRA
jgi:hypothetical protein